MRRLREIHHAGVDAPVRIQKKVFGLEMLGGLIVGKIIEKNCAENGAFGFDVCRKGLRGNVISSRHLNLFEVVFQESFSSNAKLIVLVVSLWMACA